MKFKVQRKINLANIDKELWPYETEDIGIEDADSFEEAQKMVDQLVSERIGYYKAKSEEYQINKLKVNIQQPKPSASIPAAKPVPAPGADFVPPAGVASNVPAEFQV